MINVAVDDRSITQGHGDILVTGDIIVAHNGAGVKLRTKPESSAKDCKISFLVFRAEIFSPSAKVEPAAIFLAYPVDRDSGFSVNRLELHAGRFSLFLLFFQLSLLS